MSSVLLARRNVTPGPKRPHSLDHHSLLGPRRIPENQKNTRRTQCPSVFQNGKDTADPADTEAAGASQTRQTALPFGVRFVLFCVRMVANGVDKESVTWTTSLDFSKAFLSILVSVFGDSREKVLRLLKCNLVTIF